MKTVLGGIFAALVIVVASQSFAQNQPASPTIQTTVVPCPTDSALISVPEIASDSDKRLRATLTLADGARTFNAGSRCVSVPMRYFTGHHGLKPDTDDPRFTGAQMMPGPTLRAKVGGWVEIAFFNHVNPLNFAKTLDRSAEPMSGHAMPSRSADPLAGCDKTYSGSFPSGAPSDSALITHGDAFPNCLHGSTTTNVHFHGTHTTPGSTGDNVLLFVRPTNRTTGKYQPSDATVYHAFDEFFANCESTKRYPASWRGRNGMTPLWRQAQADAIYWHDQKSATSHGSPVPLPSPQWLAPVNNREIAHGLWPQYQIGATPYCFPLPAFAPGGHMLMGQAPGTHWYHAHKHGSTALNVANGMTGALIIEGQYDDELRAFYAPAKRDSTNSNWPAKWQDQVMVIQQLTPTLNLSVPGGGPGSRFVPVLSVNGRHAPVMTLLPNQVKLLRFINGAERDAALFEYFRPQGSTASCSRQAASPCVHWNQIAQDGVQLAAQNYDPGMPADPNAFKGQDRSLYLAPGNRADLLVQAPSTQGVYELVVQAGLCRTNPSVNPPSPAPKITGCPGRRAVSEQVLLVVNVTGTEISPGMPFIPVASFPHLPPFLHDISPSEVYTRRTLVFEDTSNGLQINGKQFADGVINQSMLLNSVEEWTVANKDPDKEHPFHIHINPFQIFEVFQPQSSDGTCVKPLDPSTWKPCSPDVQKSNFVWWDTFAIPASRKYPVTCGTSPDPCQAVRDKAPDALSCPSNGTACTVTVPGYFKMRTRFVDFTGQYVLHCHILTHEDRGMMELIQVVPDTTIYTHH